MQVLVNQAETTAAYPLTTTDGTSENCRMILCLLSPLNVKQHLHCFIDGTFMLFPKKEGRKCNSLSFFSFSFIFS